ncbi:uncharacterized protein TNCV_525011 [Trichonephila clavipes]|nr:uncharacterized protein TNCV_525011 [Trichonephila clavipes]
MLYLISQWLMEKCCEDIQHIDCTATSSDLNPVRNAADNLGRCLEASYQKPAMSSKLLLAFRKMNRVPLRLDFTEINYRGKRGELLGRIDRQNSRFRTAKTIIIKFGLHASFVELESAKNAVNELLMIKIPFLLC